MVIYNIYNISQKQILSTKSPWITTRLELPIWHISCSQALIRNMSNRDDSCLRTSALSVMTNFCVTRVIFLHCFDSSLWSGWKKSQHNNGGQWCWQGRISLVPSCSCYRSTRTTDIWAKLVQPHGRGSSYGAANRTGQGEGLTAGHHPLAWPSGHRFCQPSKISSHPGKDSVTDIREREGVCLPGKERT